jgi:hypothetical protein
MRTATPDFEREGIRGIEWSFADSITDVQIAGVNAGEAQIEPLMRSSRLLGIREPSVKQLDDSKRHLRLPWKKKGPALYQIPFAVALATTAFAFPKAAAGSTPAASVTQTPIYHFQPAEHDERGIADDTVTAAQIRALDELLALPLGAEADIHVHDWS